jgi:hypothetical protein
MAWVVESSWNVMAHGDAREGKWRGNWQMDWVSSTLHTTSEHDVSSITTADAHTSAASSRLNWPPCRFKWTRPFRRKTKSGFCACAITFQTQSKRHAQAALPPVRTRHSLYRTLSKIGFDIQIISDAYHPHTPNWRQKGCEDPWLFCEAKSGPRAEEFAKHWSRHLNARALYVL